MKILFLFLFCLCVIGCGGYGGDEEEIQGVFPTNAVEIEQTEQENVVECPPEFHGEFITGKLNRSDSEMEVKQINRNVKHYFYTLNLILDDTTSINVVLEEAVLGYEIQREFGKRKMDTWIEDKDLLLVKLDHIIEPGTWKGVLIKNLTQNISF